MIALRRASMSGLRLVADSTAHVRSRRLAIAARERAVVRPLVGLRVDVDVSCPFAFGLATWTFADAIVPDAASGRSMLANLGAAALAASLLLLSLALHELAHSIVARRAGIPVVGIGLSLFGGATQLAHPPRSPAIEARIAGAGPVASAGCALLAAAVHVVLVETTADMRLAAVFAVVAVANSFIALVNIVPALPLDGGRLLRAALWQLTGRSEQAERIAAAAGRALSALLGGLAVMEAVSGNVTLALWAALFTLVIARDSRTRIAESACSSAGAPFVGSERVDESRRREALRLRRAPRAPGGLGSLGAPKASG